MLESITVLGSSSGRNAGDAALLSGLMDSIDEACATRLSYEIPTIKPDYITANYPNRVTPIGMMPWDLSVKMLGLPTYRSIMRTDLSLIFDAPLFDRSLYNPLFNFLSTFYLMLPSAKRRGKRVGMFNVGVGPISTPAGARMLRAVAEACDFVTVRDVDSLTILRDAGVTNQRVLVTADAALTVKPASRARADEILRSAGLDPEEEILAFNLSAYLDSWASPGRKGMPRESFVKAYCSALNRILAELNVPVLFVGTQVHDVDLTREVMSHVRSTKPIALVSNRDYNHLEIQGVLGRVALLFGMRLHAIILASAGLAPVCALPHQPKVSYYLKTLGLEGYALHFDNFSEDSLVNHVLRSWSERGRIRKQLEERIPIQRAEAFKAARIVAAMRQGDDLDDLLGTLGGSGLDRAAHL